MSKLDLRYNKQEEILQEIARKHGLNILQAREIFNLFGANIADIISSTDKRVDNYYHPEKFQIIHIDHLGKFIPNQRKIRHANFCLNKKHNNDNNIETYEHNI